MSLVNDIKWIQRAVGVEVDGVFGPRTAAAVLRSLRSQTEDCETEDGREEALDGLDARTRATIETLDEKARERFEHFALVAKATAATFGCDYVAISGHRSWAEQDALFARVPQVTRARGGESNHNFGIAADFAVFQGKVYLDEIQPALAARVHAACAVHATEHGLEWGGAWTRFKDAPHYEIRTGLTLDQKRNVYLERGSVL